MNCRKMSNTNKQNPYSCAALTTYKRSRVFKTTVFKATTSLECSTYNWSSVFKTTTGLVCLNGLWRIESVAKDVGLYRSPLVNVACTVP